MWDADGRRFSGLKIFKPFSQKAEIELSRQKSLKSFRDSFSAFICENQRPI